MDLNMNEAQKKIYEAARELSRKEIAPLADKIGRGETWAHELLPKLGEAGLLGIPPAKEHGGGDWVSAVLTFEEIAAACTSTAMSAYTSGYLAALPIALAGSDEQKDGYLTGLASGELIGCFALTEPHCGSDASAIKTVAEKKNGVYVLNGIKACVTHGPVMDTAVVFARTPDSKGAEGICALVVEKDAPGLSAGEESDMLCARGLRMSELVFKDCEVPAANLIGEQGAGLSIATDSLECGNLIMAAVGMGLIRASMEESIRHAESRWAFGKLIGAFQSVNHKIADMRMFLEVGRQLLYYAAWRKDRDEKCGPDISMAKLFAAENAFQAVADAVQIHGSAGLTSGSRVERLYRDVKICSMAGGTNEVLRDAIARDTLAD